MAFFWLILADFTAEEQLMTMVGFAMVFIVLVWGRIEMVEEKQISGAA
jgi:hypothetical protein